MKKGKRMTERTGRRIVVNGKEWIYRVGRVFVNAYSGNEKKCQAIWQVKGLPHPDLLERGRQKHTSYGMLTPKEVAQWLKGDA